MKSHNLHTPYQYQCFIRRTLCHTPKKTYIYTAINTCSLKAICNPSTQLPSQHDSAPCNYCWLPTLSCMVSSPGLSTEWIPTATFETSISVAAPAVGAKCKTIILHLVHTITIASFTRLRTVVLYRPSHVSTCSSAMTPTICCITHLTQKYNKSRFKVHRKDIAHDAGTTWPK